MKGLQRTASKAFLTGMLALTPLLAQDPKGQKQGIADQGNVAENNRQTYPHHKVSHRQLGMNYKAMDTNGDGKICKVEFDSAFAKMVSKRAEAIVVVVGPITYLLRKPIADLALKNRLPAICTLSQYAQDGLLMTYGPKLTDLYVRAASYVDKILRGAKPADLPVEQPSRFELTVNLKTAGTLGVHMPPSLQLLAAEVIE